MAPLVLVFVVRSMLILVTSRILLIVGSVAQHHAISIPHNNPSASCHTEDQAMLYRLCETCVCVRVCGDLFNFIKNKQYETSFRSKTTCEHSIHRMSSCKGYYILLENLTKARVKKTSTNGCEDSPITLGVSRTRILPDMHIHKVSLKLWCWTPPSHFPVSGKFLGSTWIYP